MSELVAIVVLHPAGRALSGDEPITADTIEHFLPPAGALEEAIDWFASAGFVVEPSGPISFSISAEPALYESLFGDAAGPDFDIDALPPRVRRLLAAVEIPEPPDFGPGNP
jgi:hypothetical protein